MADSLEQRLASMLPDEQQAPNLIEDTTQSMLAPEEASMEGMEIVWIARCHLPGFH